MRHWDHAVSCTAAVHAAGQWGQCIAARRRAVRAMQQGSGEAQETSRGASRPVKDLTC